MTMGRAFRLKIPGVATHERGQQELAPNRSGGRAARDDLVPGYTAGVSPALLSLATGVMAWLLSSHHAETDKLPRAPVWVASERCEGNTSFAGGLTSKAEGRQSSVRETHLDQLHLRARGTKTPRSRLAGSPLPYAPTWLHFHPLPCLGQTSRFT